ncbi:MAG: glycosyltransferase family 4 protein [Bacteroidota bacterium]
MEDRIRLIVVEPNGSGGLIHYAYQLCTALAQQGLDVTLVTGSEYELAHLPHIFHVENMLDLWTLFDPQIMQAQELHGLRRWWGKLRWTLRRAVRAVRLIRAWMRLTAYLVRQKADIVQFSKINFPFEALFLGWLRRRGLLLTQICHEFELRESSGPLGPAVLALYRNVYTHFSAIFFHAKENRDRFLSLFPFIPASRTYIIPHGNSGWLLKLASQGPQPDALRQRYRLAPDQKVALFFGLLAPSKGIEDLVDAFARIPEQEGARLLIAGYPTKHFELGKLRARISGLGLRDRVVIDPRYVPLEEVGALMELATVVIYPYRSSTQSGALQAAYTFGRPVIATAVGGLPEAVDEGKSGFLVPVRSPAMLAERMALLLRNPRLAAEMGGHARHLSETRFSWDSIAREISRIYRNLVVDPRSL